MQDGDDIAAFNLSIDLDFLLNSDGKFAIGIGISSSERETNPKFSTTIVVINTAMLQALVEPSYFGAPNQFDNFRYPLLALWKC